MAGRKWFERRRAEAPDPRRDLAREEARLWIWTATTTFLALLAFGLSAVPFPQAGPSAPYAALQLPYEQTAPALLLLMLLFNSQMLRRRWAIHRSRRQLDALQEARAQQDAVPESAGLDEVTGLGNRRAAELQLGKEMAWARRRGEPLSLLIIGVENFVEVRRQAGQEASDQLLRDFAQQLRRATRGADFLARLGEDEFLAILPRCPLGEVSRVARRLGPLTVRHQRKAWTVEVSTGWLDPQPGETPDGPLKRAQEMLRLYKTAQTDEAAAHAER